MACPDKISHAVELREGRLVPCAMPYLLLVMFGGQSKVNPPAGERGTAVPFGRGRPYDPAELTEAKPASARGSTNTTTH